jgi:hypothetical protein
MKSFINLAKIVSIVSRDGDLAPWILRRATFRIHGFLRSFVMALDLEGYRRIQVLEERTARRDRDLALLTARVLRGEDAFTQLSATIDSLIVRVYRQGGRRAPVDPPPSAPSAPIEPPPTKPPPPTAPSSPRTTRDFVVTRLPRAPSPPRPSDSSDSGLTPPPARVFPSEIIADRPELFLDVPRSSFTILWRGTRDGFRARDFHRRCDGHPNTLTLILDTKGNMFGGFTPAQWDCSDKYKPDPTLTSFIFTLKNPHDFPPTKFRLKSEKKDFAILCDSSRAAVFRDISVSDNSNTNAESFTRFFGRSYNNPTDLDERTFFTGSEDFTVKEIEVFEIAKQTA